MRLSKQWVTTNSYIETYDVSEEMLKAFKATLDINDWDYSDLEDYDFVLECQDELYDFLEAQRMGGAEVGYSDNEELVDSYFNEYYIDKD